MSVLEIAVQDPSGARIARQAGACRVELCQALATGGLTPSQGLMVATISQGLPVHVLVRPREGGYQYSSEEVAWQLDDVARAVGCGAAGVVVGALDSRGQVDLAMIRQVVQLAGAAQVTFHRAFDVCVDQFEAIDQLVELGVKRILTSGGAPRAIEGLDQLERLVAHAARRIEIQAGGGVQPSDIAALAAAGVDGIHLSAKRAITAGPAGPGGGEPWFYQ
ncbi:MAG: copper homeostasis protein CutC, partial [Micrococcales bacterium]|nr:copper homeostasis protein CutC [Micrococcales bacterium]